MRLLAPFDPVVWDRRRFELLWGWTYRFEAYTPAPKRTLGYYALPLLWRDAVVGWANAVGARAAGSPIATASSRRRRSGRRRSSGSSKAERARLADFLGL